MHPARCRIFDEVDDREREEMVRELESRSAEFERKYGKSLDAAGLAAVVDATVRHGVMPETMYRRYTQVEQEIHAFEKEFETLYGLRIRFAEDALRELVRLVLNGSEEALIVCRKIFQNYHHGLKLVMERSGAAEFTIPIEAIRNPEVFLNDMIQQTYRQQEADERT